MTDVTTITIIYLRGQRFVDTEVSAQTVGALKTELNIPNNAAIAIGGIDVLDSHALADGDEVAAVIQNKTGGITTFKVEKNVRIPERTYGSQGGISKYPFKEMKKGDSFVVPVKTGKKATSASYRYTLVNPKVKFTRRTINKGKKTEMVRIWRTK